MIRLGLGADRSLTSLEKDVGVAGRNDDRLKEFRNEDRYSVEHGRTEA